MGRRLGRAWPSTYRPLTLRYRYGLHTAARDGARGRAGYRVRAQWALEAPVAQGGARSPRGQSPRVRRAASSVA